MSRWSDLFPSIGMLLRPVVQYLGRWLHRIVMITGGVALVMIVLAFTRLPYDAHRWLGVANGECISTPGAIVILGGSGMPSGPELLRLDHAARIARTAPTAAIHVVHVEDTTTIFAMRDELVLRGLAGSGLVLHAAGGNTREQALFLATNAPELLHQRVAIVTAPENMYRSIGTFRKVGFTDLCGASAFDQALFADLGYRFKQIGGRWVAPDVSGSLDLRYTFWNYLKLEITCIREYLAIAYYQLNDWM